MQVLIADQPQDVRADETCAEILGAALSGKKIKKTVACKCGDTLHDLNRPLPADCTHLEPVYSDEPDGLDIVRHSTAHIMAEAVKKLFPRAKVAIGPAVENGFYYDFEFDRSFTPEDLTAIEQEMERIVAQDEPFVRRDVSVDEARKCFLSCNEVYKLELLEDMEEDRVSLYQQGNFVDLCRGPHVPSTGRLQAFKLTSVAGAYWRGDEHRPMLQRIYGTAWASEKDLKQHLKQLEEARKRDHRKLGAELELFTFSDQAGPGMPLFMPKGALIRTILEDFETKEHLKRGYELVRGPQLLRRELWKKSGHYDNYRENMYFSEIDEQVYGIKPMNCLSHMLIYKSSLRSYRDLPLRFFELGLVHRHEKSGVLHGLMRVRQFTQDDAHILCRPDQLQEEITCIIRLVQDLMQLFDFEYDIEISTRPEKSIGTEEDWDRAIQALQQALEHLNLNYSINAGDGAFYGPKIDVKLRDALNRQWQCSTIQCDFTLPHRFDLQYIGQDGERHRPVMLHRTIFGAIERFMGVLIEHYAGALPAWLSPVQARLLSITDEQQAYIRTCQETLRSYGLRVEIDERNEKLGFKVREAQMAKIPYILVAGNQEVQDQSLNLRLRDGTQQGSLSIEGAAKQILNECQQPFTRGGMSYSFTY
ncbi:MAG: threonine--tRNA ligase [Desulfohalobiaceae bacterium]|nr:threonine--tRNA ligase [Desulfohalobiaceae bacterium]